MCYGEVSCIYQMAAGVAETVFLYFAFTKKKHYRALTCALVSQLWHNLNNYFPIIIFQACCEH